jgi:predicted DNA-binding WGR domain protein
MQSHDGTQGGERVMPVQRIEPVRLTRIRPERRERRFYRLEIVTDLFGTILLRRCWGRIGMDGQHKSQAFADIGAASAALTRQAARKRRRGYSEMPSMPAF